MATGQLATVVKHLQRTALQRNLAGLTDGELLGAFLARRDAAAFEMLVRRHGAMVLGVCRRVLGNPDDAEDAFQVTFLVLVRRARSVVPRAQVGNWLHGVAYRTALAARRVAARRRAREKQVRQMPEPATDAAPTDADLQPFIDRELSQLPAKYRLPVVLCDLEGRTQRDAARQLCVPVGTLSNRLAAGRKRLSRRLTRRGLTLSVGTVAALCGPDVSAHLPAALVAVTVHTAIQVAAGPAGLAALAPEMAALTKGVLHSMWLTKLQLTAAVMLTLGVLGAGTAWTLQPSPDRAAAAGDARRAAPPAVPPKADAGKAVARSQAILHDALKEFNDAIGEPGALPHRLLADMAGLQARLGDRPAARKLFAQADAIVAALPQVDQPGEWRMLAGAQATAGEVDAALATTLRIPEGNQFRDITFQEVATALAKQRQEKDALRIGDMVSDPEKTTWIRPMLLEHLALAHAANGDIPAALRVVERMKAPSSAVVALAGMSYFNLSFVEYPEQPGVALLQARAGDQAAARATLQRAAKLTASMNEAQALLKNRAMTALACAQAQLGDYAAARKTAAGITHKNGQAIALATLVRQLGKAGRTKEAMAEIERLPAGVAQVFALTHLGAGQAKAGNQRAAIASFDRAHALIGQLQESDRRSQAHVLASARANAGDYQGAAQTAGAFCSDDSLSDVNIAYARAEAGDFTGALQMAEKYKGSAWWQGNLFRAIGKLQAEHGQAKAALEWIGRLDAPLARANALLGVAEGLVTAKR